MKDKLKRGLKRRLFRYVFKLLKWYQEETYERLRTKYNIPRSFRFNGKEIRFYGDGKLEIGANSYIGSYSTIQLHKDCRVVIGKGCSISHNVRIYTSSKIPDWDFKDKANGPGKKGDIIIDDYAWVGANVFINPGITIGENAVVGANSVVTKDVAPYAIVGGIPARLIRMKKIDRNTEY